MQNLPIGIQTFSQIREENYCYVDKTPLIEQLISKGKYYFLSRPRRFGKSLLISTLHAIFSGQQALFKNLYLEKHWNWSEQYPVICLDLSLGVAQNREQLDQTLQSLLHNQAEVYQIKLLELSPHLMLNELIIKCAKKTKKRVVVLIDEYDKPLLDNIDNAQAALSVREGLKNLYSVLKTQDARLRFVFLTGVSKFSKVSLFSGLNNLTDISLDKRYATLCGYTEKEIKQIFQEYLKEVDFDLLRQWYNGYNFLGEKVYNPFDVLLYLEQREFKNYWFETGSPAFLLKLIQQRQYLIPQLESVFASESLLSSFDIEQIEIETLLFQAGYLTIESSEDLGGERFYTLCYPNREVKSSLTNFILSYLTHAPALKAKNQKGIYYALLNADFVSLKNLFQAFFASIPHDWYRKNQLAHYEGYYASIVYCYFAALGIKVIAEDCTNHGRIDLTIQLEDKLYLLEFKVVDSNTCIGKALAQIKTKNYAEKYCHKNLQIYLLGVTFNKNTRNIVDFTWEKK